MENQNHILDYLLQIADNNLILGHRLSELCGHGPALEQDIALTNIALDLIGQSRSLFALAAKVENKGNSEDHFAYFRDVWDFKNLLITEQPNGDFAHVIARQFLYDVFHRSLISRLIESSHEDVSAYAQKSIKEIKYHFKYSSEWVIRLGDGTEESHERMQLALDNLYPYFGEAFEASEVDNNATSEINAPMLSDIKTECLALVKQVCEEAILNVPEIMWSQSGGKKGMHTEHLGYILSDMQFLQRAYPGNEW